jgi:outer membrane autotransporter protein
MSVPLKTPNAPAPLGGHVTASIALAKALFSIGTLASVCLLVPPKLARAQALQANGTTVTALPGVYGPVTGPVNAQGGTAFDAINGGVIDTSGVVQLLASEPGSRGVWAHQGSVTLFPGSTVSTSGDGEAYGLQASGAASQVTATDITVKTTGQLDSATGFSPNGILANSGGGVTLNGGSVTTQGDSAIGAYSFSASTVSLTNVVIDTTTGDDSAGLLAFAGGSSITVHGGSVSTSGASAFGAWAFGNGTITLANTSVTTTGPDAVALVADAGGPTGQPTEINVTGSTVISRASGGAQVNDGAALILAQSQLTGQTYGVSITDTEGTGLTNLLTLDGAKLVSVTGDAISVDGAVATITAMNGTTISSGSGNLVNATNLSSVALTVDGSALTGNLMADATSTANGQLLNSSQLTGAIQSWHDLSVDATSSWTITANSNLTGTITNAGLVEFTAPDPFKTLTARNYVGVGGTLGLNTYLGSDGSASDKLIINGGAATGNSLLRITNAGGPGAQTRADGILVVQAINGATTAPGAFTLSNGELRAGAFDYDLFHGGVGGSNPADWFLRSTIAPGPGPGPEPLPPQPPILPPTPPPNPLPPGVAFPIIGPELATYGVVQPLARQLGLSILGTLDDRVGDTYEPDGCPVAPAVAAAALPTRKPGPALAPCPLFSPSVWGRFFGQTLDNHYQAFTDPRASGSLGGFQGGIDLLRGSVIAGHYERAGLYGAYGDVHADVDGLVTNPAATAYVLAHTGSMNLNSGSAGAYWTHVGPGGWYLDAVLQGTWYYGSASTQFARLNTDGAGFIASLEGGYPFAWPQLGPGFVIEPQGQILWQKVSFRHDYDGLGEVALGDTTGPSGRIGLRAKWTVLTAGGQVWQPYLRANLWRDWGAEANTVFSGTDSVPLLSQTTMLELGGGLTGRINANVSVFANVDYEFAVGAAETEKRNGVRGAFGAKYTW